MEKYQTTIILILFAHFVADFICQTDWMARNKSKNNYALLTHGSAYFFAMMAILSVCKYTLHSSVFYCNSYIGLFLYVMVNTSIHIAIDYVTSRITSYLWARQQVHNFFVVIGLDQFLHAATLIATTFLLEVIIWIRY